MAVTQVPVRFVTKHAEYAVPDASVLVPQSMQRAGLSEVVNHLRSSADHPVPFEFFINGTLLRTSLEDYLVSNDLTAETALELEYVPGLVPPKLQRDFPHQDWISGVDASGSEIVTASYDGVVRVWSRSGAVEQALSGHDGACLHCVARAGDGATLLAGAQDQTVSAWQRGKKVAVYVGHTSAVHALAVAPGSDKFISASWDGVVNIWSTRDDQPAADAGGSKKRRVATSMRSPLGQLLGHHGPATGAALSSDASKAFTAGWDHTLRHWDVETMVELVKKPSPCAVQCLARSAVSGLVATGHSDGSLRIWDLREASATETLAQLALANAHASWVSGIAWSPRNEHQLVTAGYDGRAKVVDMRGRAPLFVAKDAAADGTKLLCCDWQGDLVFVGGEDAKLRAYGVAHYG